MPEKGTSVRPELSSWLEESRAWAEVVLERFFPREGAQPEYLHRAMRYSLFGGGKRLRPALVRLVCTELGGDEAAAERPAAALELIHTYSLMHDDLPCMDDDDLRRGRATCHVAFDEATAVLAGDALLTLAFEILAGARGAGAELALVLARAAGSQGMVGGQVVDLRLAVDGTDEERRAAVRELHRLKTAALFAASAEMGAIVAGADEAARTAARDYGTAVGLCFQAVDDLLDVTGDAATLGKTPGKDAALERVTLVAALGLEGARAEAARLAGEAEQAAGLLGWMDQDLPCRLVKFVLSRST